MGSPQEPKKHGTGQRLAGHGGVGSLGVSLSRVSAQRLPDLATDLAVAARQLGELLRFRPLVRHLYAYDLDAELVHRLLSGALDLWSQVLFELQAFERWLLELAALD